jgi:glycosidase
MDGGPDPANRAPMRWDLATDDNPDLQFTRQLIRLRKENRALRTGAWRVIDTEKLFAFSRQTDKAAESVIVVANPTTRPVTEVFSPRDGKLMSGMPLRDQLDPSVEVRNFSGRIELEVPAKTVRVLKAVVPDNSREYSPYKRVR